MENAKNSFETDHLDNPIGDFVGKAADLCWCFQKRAALHTSTLRAPYSEQRCLFVLPSYSQDNRRGSTFGTHDSPPSSLRASYVRVVDPSLRLLQHIHTHRNSFHLFASTQCAPAVTAPDSSMLTTVCRTASMLRRDVLVDKGKGKGECGLFPP